MSRAERKASITQMQMIFQDPYSSLNPRQTVGKSISEPMIVHNIMPKTEIRDHVVGLLKKVGLGAEHFDRYPHEFSGGQRQRIGIARALIMEPEFVVCDEPISALDVSVQAQVINLLDALKASMGLTMLFIAHDLSMVRYVSDRMAVMYLGKIVELADCNEIYLNSLHPYTQALMSAIPRPDPSRRGKPRYCRSNSLERLFANAGAPFGGEVTAGVGSLSGS